jgi:ribonuclease BN (tRNA processing enzyme)
MELAILGAGPAYTNRPGAAGASYLVKTKSTFLLLDLGQGAFTNLAQALEPSELTAILISHLHPDHYIDLIALRHYLYFEFRPGRRLPVYAPPGLAARLDFLHADPNFTSGALDVYPLTTSPWQIGSFQICAQPVTHLDNSYAFRLSVDAGPGLVYSGDCGRAQDLLPLIRPGDTLLVEASFGALATPAGINHLNAATAAQIATTGEASRLLLTHLLMGFNPESALDTARAFFSGPVQFVSEGDVFEI